MALRLLSFLAMYLLLFGAKFHAFDVTVFAVVVFASYYSMTVFYKGWVRKEVLLSGVYLTAMLCYFVLISSIFAQDASPLLNEFGKLPMYLAAAAGITRFYIYLYSKDFEVYILKDVFVSLVATAVLVIFLFINPGLRNELYSLLDLYIFHDRDPTAFSNRIVDLSIGGSTVSLMLFFSIIFLVDNRVLPACRNAFIRVLYYLLILFATLLTGRTGLLLLLGYTLFLLSRGFLFRPVEVVKNMAAGLFVLAIIFAITLPLLSTEAVTQFNDHIAPWAFELLYTYLDDGVASSSSGEFILSQYVSPDTALGIVFGGGGYDIPYDSSFVKLFHSVGLVGMSMVVAIFCVPFIWLAGRHSFSKRYLAIYIVVLLIGNLKETMLGNSRGAIILYFVLVMSATYAVSLSRARLVGANSPVNG